jgi:hypothetical protein
MWLKVLMAAILLFVAVRYVCAYLF